MESKLEEIIEENKMLKAKLALKDLIIDNYEKIVETQDESIKIARGFFIFIFVCGVIQLILELLK